MTLGTYMDLKNLTRVDLMEGQGRGHPIVS